MANARSRKAKAVKVARHSSFSGAGQETEVARFRRERDEALEQQAATAEVLKALSHSTFDLQSVLESLLEKAVRLCDAEKGLINRQDGDVYRVAASYGHSDEFLEKVVKPNPIRTNRSSATGRAVVERRVVHIHDILADPEYHWGKDQRDHEGMHRTILAVPMLKGDAIIGVIVIRRTQVLPFTDKQIELLTTFAAQAVIAIENTRLLNELRESLRQQTATADVLKVISRSTFDLQTVLDTLVESAARLCEADDATIHRPKDDFYPLVANYGYSHEFLQYMRDHPIKLHRGSVLDGAVLEGKVVQVADVLADPNYAMAEQRRVGKYRTVLGAPLMREGTPIGVIMLTRSTVRPFTDKQVELVSTFADQAVIAIENARLLSELRERTDDLSESLEQQTATSKVLQVISSSPGQLNPVFNTVLENAVRICGAKFGILYLVEGDGCHTVAMHDVPKRFAEKRTRTPFFKPPPSGKTPMGRVMATRQVAQIDDITQGCLLEEDQALADLAELGGARTVLAVPMIKDVDLVGGIVIYRQQVRRFTEKQIELVQNFAAQAVIAIENTRLLNELRESLQQQTATADVLKVISRSTFDLHTVLQTLVESVARLCDAEKTIITREKNGVFYRAEAYGFSREFMDHVKDIPIKPERGSSFGRALLEGRVVHIPDVNTDPEYTFFDHAKLGDYRTILSVPMLRESVSIGVVTLCRSEMRPFTEKQIELASTFADQAAIAIENVRLFEGVETRTRELAASLEDLRATQDRLVQTQKLASLGQLTAGIAHEIKNPLNFVNNFSGVSVELIDELRQALAGADLDSKLRAEISEIANTLQGNLDKVVQHGKRADAIVKNMLLHSREGSGEHRVVDINSLVEESLNLAYHGARAEKQGFNITMQRSLDPAAGQADVFPQDLTRVLLNLISNGFYAATKRRGEADGDGYEPTLVASTRSLGDRVEIRVRDNGTGIPPEVKEKMFNPFFTTKPAGEGTGLGLSICHDIIVKQHGGSIEVDTQPGEFTEITVTLPRAASFI